MLAILIQYPPGTLFNNKFVVVFFNELPFYSFLMNIHYGTLAKMCHQTVFKVSVILQNFHFNWVFMSTLKSSKRISHFNKSNSA